MWRPHPAALPQAPPTAAPLPPTRRPGLCPVCHSHIGVWGAPDVCRAQRPRRAGALPACPAPPGGSRSLASPAPTPPAQSCSASSPGDPPLPPAGTRPDRSHCPRFQARFPPVRWELLPRSWFPSGSSRELGEVGSRGSQASPPRRCPPGPRSPWARPTSARMPPRDPRSPGHRETAWAGCWFWVTEFRWPLGRRSPQHAVNHLVSSVGRASQGLPGSTLVGGAWGGLLWHPEGLRVRAPWIKMLRVAPYLSPPGCSVPTSGVNNGRAGGGRRPVSPAAASLP